MPRPTCPGLLAPAFLSRSYIIHRGWLHLLRSTRPCYSFRLTILPRLCLGVLNDTEVLERWDQSLTARAQAGLEPNLVLFYNFDRPDLPEVPNLGSAGSEYDLLLGRVADLSTQSDDEYYDTFLKRVQSFEKPKFVPAWALPRASSDPGSPLVTSAASRATISIEVPGLASLVSYTAPPAPWVSTSVFTASNGRTIHVLPRNKPVGAAPAHLRRVSGAEDALALLQASGANDLGLCMHAVVTALPTHGQLFVIANGYDAQSQVLLNTRDPDPTHKRTFYLVITVLCISRDRFQLRSRSRLLDLFLITPRRATISSSSLLLIRSEHRTINLTSPSGFRRSPPS